MIRYVASDRFLLAFAGILLGCAMADAAKPLPQRLRINQLRPGQLRTMFGTYGPPSAAALGRGRLLFRFPRRSKTLSEAGLYSHFALAGDFLITVSYESCDPSDQSIFPQASLGIAVDADNAPWHASVRWGRIGSDGVGYLLQVGKAGDEPASAIERRFVPCAGRKGIMALRRMGDELVFLAATGSSQTPAEIGRMPCIVGTIRTVRFFSVAGPSRRDFDARLTRIELEAEGITGGIPKADASAARWWWLAAAISTLPVILAVLWLRRHSTADRAES